MVGGSEGVDGVWGDSGDGNGRRRRKTVSGGAGDRGPRKLVRADSGSKGGGVRGFGFWRGVGGVRDVIRDGDERRQRQTVIGGAGGGVRDNGRTGDGGRQQRGKAAAARAAD